MDLINLSTSRKSLDKKGLKKKTEKKSDKQQKQEQSPSEDELKRKLDETLQKLEEAKQSTATSQPKVPPRSKISKSHGIPDSSISSTDSDFETSGSKDSFGTGDGMGTGDRRSDNSLIVNYSDVSDKKKNSEENLEEQENSKKKIPSIEEVKEGIKVESVTDLVNSDIDDPDLYGKNWPEEPMVKLVKHVYCKKTEYDQIKPMCNQASHVVRRLIPGVFKPSGYLDATYTGQAPRAHSGKKNKVNPAPVKALNNTARNEIIDYAMNLAAENKWTGKNGIAQTKDDLKRVMTQKIGELKRAHALNNPDPSL